MVPLEGEKKKRKITGVGEGVHAAQLSMTKFMMMIRFEFQMREMVPSIKIIATYNKTETPASLQNLPKQGNGVG